MINPVDASGRMLMQKAIGASTTLYRLKGIGSYSLGVNFLQVISETGKTDLKFVNK